MAPNDIYQLANKELLIPHKWLKKLLICGHFAQPESGSDNGHSGSGEFRTRLGKDGTEIEDDDQEDAEDPNAGEKEEHEDEGEGVTSGGDEDKGKATTKNSRRIQERQQEEEAVIGSQGGTQTSSQPLEVVSFIPSI